MSPIRLRYQEEVPSFDAFCDLNQAVRDGQALVVSLVEQLDHAQRLRSARMEKIKAIDDEIKGCDISILKWKNVKEASLAIEVLRHKMSEDSNAIHGIESQLATAMKKRDSATKRIAEINKCGHACFAELNKWKRLRESVLSAKKVRDQVVKSEIDIACIEKNYGEASAKAAELTDRVKSIARDLDVVNSELATHTQLRSSISQHGLGSYLARATPAERHIIDRFAKDSQTRGQATRKFKRKSTSESRAARAALARERRAKAAEIPLTPEQETKEEKRRLSRRNKRRADRLADRPQWPTEEAEDAAHAVGVGPQSRQHQQRLRRMEGDNQHSFAERLKVSRSLGHAAAISDAEFRRSLGSKLYVPIGDFSPRSLGGGARLIAIRDPHGSLRGKNIDLMEFISKDLHAWLMEPVGARAIAMGKRSRLTDGILHIVAGWPPHMAKGILNGELDVPTAHQLDLFLARFDLRGHRAVAILHNDSQSGHPHIHIVISRVCEADLSMWSLEGRQRSLALWLHARSNTAIVLGDDALNGDIDALAASGRSAWEAEGLMAAGQLHGIRTMMDGVKVPVFLQGESAAQRINAVGSLINGIAGGIWLWGLGIDPREKNQWFSDLRAAYASGDPNLIREVTARKPKSRGYWGGDGKDFGGNGGFGKYLGR